MRITIATRISLPEPSAASFRLDALARTLSEAGDQVTVLTVRPPRGLEASHAPYAVSRFPVLRDRTGYVRGYIQYLSFDIPLFFRILLRARPDAVVVEPPPTSAFVTALACKLRGIPFFSYAADIWSDAAATTGARPLVVRTVRWMESYAWQRAAGVLSVNEGVTERVTAITPKAAVTTVGNGVDTTVFKPEGQSRNDGPYVVYTGTASEWQGADIFVRAMAAMGESHPEAKLVFLGQGTAWGELQDLAKQLRARVEFVDTVPAEEAAKWLRGARASLASMHPDAKYTFAYPTKIFAAWATGTPVVYAGEGPAKATLQKHPELGLHVNYETQAVIAALERVFDENTSDPRRPIADWAQHNVSLSGVALKIRAAVRRTLGLTDMEPSV